MRLPVWLTARLDQSMTRLNAEYLAAGANRHPSAADWDENGILAFGADRNVALWAPQVRIEFQLSFKNGPQNEPYRSLKISLDANTIVERRCV
jgi:hypothetical protein